MHPVLLDVFGFKIYTYGFCVAAAFLTCAFLAYGYSRRTGEPFNEIADCFFWVLLSGLVGGRMLYVIVNIGYFASNPWLIPVFRDGGMAFHGSLIAGAAAGIITCRVKKLSFWKMSDVVAPYIALGHSIGRIGCYLNGCCYGRTVDNGFGVVFPGDVAARIPVQLYSSLVLALLFLFLTSYRERKPFDGSVFLVYLLIFSLVRFLSDFLRADNPGIFFSLTLAQVLSVGIFIVGAYFFRMRRGEAFKKVF
ncbi:MAG: prolipoprotein diacylglyceryl transferase [Candidatus Omnitrophica bacterium]|nr:prolipoprotein diacylglyceryl transferase [Candidatus Omnitrophota bacterium]